MSALSPFPSSCLLNVFLKQHFTLLIEKKIRRVEYRRGAREGEREETRGCTGGGGDCSRNQKKGRREKVRQAMRNGQIDRETERVKRERERIKRPNMLMGVQDRRGKKGGGGGEVKI